MKSILIILILFTSTLLEGQENKSISEANIYCTIIGVQGPMKKKASISIDFGNAHEGASKIKLSKEDERISQSHFESMTDALNQLSTAGWTLKETYGVLRSNDRNIHYWILNKKIGINSK